MLIYARYQKKCDELEVANGQFNDKFTQMETDKREVVAFWKRQVEAKSKLSVCLSVSHCACTVCMCVHMCVHIHVLVCLHTCHHVHVFVCENQEI